MDITVITELRVATDDVDVCHDVLPASSCASLNCFVNVICFNNVSDLI